MLKNKIFYSDLHNIQKDLESVFNKLSFGDDVLNKIFVFTVNGSSVPYSKLNNYLNSFSEEAECKAFSFTMTLENKRYELLLNCFNNIYNLSFFEDGKLQGEQPFNDKSSFNQEILIKDEKFQVNILVHYFYLLTKDFLLEFSKYNKINNF